jgi:hypothetical protein
MKSVVLKCKWSSKPNKVLSVLFMYWNLFKMWNKFYSPAVLSACDFSDFLIFVLGAYFI